MWKIQCKHWKMLPGSQCFCDVLLGVPCVEIYCYLQLRAEGRSYRKHCSRKTRKRRPNENWGILADFRVTRDFRRRSFMFPESCHPLCLPGVCSPCEGAKGNSIPAETGQACNSRQSTNTAWITHSILRDAFCHETSASSLFKKVTLNFVSCG